MKKDYSVLLIHLDRSLAYDVIYNVIHDIEYNIYKERARLFFLHLLETSAHAHQLYSSALYTFDDVGYKVVG